MTPIQRASRIQEVIKRDGPHCVWCSARLSAHHPDATVDHALPYAKDGSNRIENLLLACEACNGARGTTPLDQFARHMREQGYAVRRRAITRAQTRISEDPNCRRSVCAAASGFRLEERPRRRLSPPRTVPTRRRARAQMPRTTQATAKATTKATIKAPKTSKVTSIGPATKSSRTGLARRTATLVASLRPRIELVEELAWAQAA